MKLSLILLCALCGCSIRKYNQPPWWASVVNVESSFYGLDATIPVGGGVGFGVKLGGGRTLYTVLPVTTNAVFIPKFSNTVSLGQTVNPFDTRVRMYLQTGWEGEAMPPPAMLFAPTQSPKDKAK